MHSTHLRKEHIHGVLLGIALGESIGYARSGLSRRRALKKFGRTRAAFQFVPGKGVYGENTRLAMLHAQALLNSRNEMSNFRPAFRWRLSWYLLSLPPASSSSTLKSSAKGWLRKLRVETGVRSRNNRSASRAVFSAPTMHGTGHRIARWTDECTKLTHTHPLAIEGCRVLAALADYGCTHPDDFDAKEALTAATEASQDANFKKPLEELASFLEAGKSPRAVARHFDYATVSSDIIPTTVMAAYCWLRYPKNFERAVISAVSLGGDTATTGAVVGGLVGAHIGRSKLPESLVKRLAGKPHGRSWIKQVANRFSHWPHGADDLYMAPAEPTYPLMQIARNLAIQPWRFINLFRR